jgi:glyoxylase-like metal-dependent hydrolase (beta-lactamase superfamily II)
MRNLLSTAALAAVSVLSVSAQDARTVIANASKMTALDSTQSLTLAGSATLVNFGQAPTSTGPWQGNLITNYVRSMTLGANLASRATGSQLTPPITGGPPTAQPYNQNIPANTTAWGNLLELHLTPWGFLQAAAANNASLSAGTAASPYYSLSYNVAQKAPSGVAYKVTGLINKRTMMVDRVSTAVEHPLWGDLPVENVYGDYRDFKGAKIPFKIQQFRGGDLVLNIDVASAESNPANITALMTPPAAAQAKGGAAPPPAAGGAPAAPAAQSEKIADGVYRITGGYVALAIEMKDGILVLEGGQSEARGLAIIAEAKRLIPNKPIRWVFNTHYHFDHTSGLAPFVAEGATIITQENNVAYLTKALSAPRTLAGDVLAKSGKKPKFMSVAEKGQLSDSLRTVEFHHIINMNHTNGMLIAYLPKERVIFQGDFTLPAAGQAPNEFVRALGPNLQRLGLDYDRYIPVHAPNPDVPWTKATVDAALAR